MEQKREEITQEKFLKRFEKLKNSLPEGFSITGKPDGNDIITL
ncbi:MAG: hypothetical protein ABH971_01885 [bacterium]